MYGGRHKVRLEVLKELQSMMTFIISLLYYLLGSSKGQGGSTISLTENVRMAILQQMNDVRRNVIPTAEYMNILVRKI